eukprot:GHRR01023347.1.p1 GENE.GHRR01023347.1~~GHRR01023347.1.p1  ORF type:complete len:154 (-),score=22.03 GHRR01023347.1:123-584(-)
MLPSAEQFCLCFVSWARPLLLHAAGLLHTCGAAVGPFADAQDCASKQLGLAAIQVYSSYTRHSSASGFSSQYFSRGSLLAASATFLCEMAAEISSTLSHAAAHSPVVPDSHFSSASLIAVSTAPLSCQRQVCIGLDKLSWLLPRAIRLMQAAC